jgi:very-short-patch-repair endonuclease
MLTNGGTSPPPPLPRGEGRNLTTITKTVSGERGVAARQLRRHQTDAEKKLWLHLRNRHLGGFKFRRQVPFGPYIADFCCLEARLIIELDGGYHRTITDRDSNRTEALAQIGYRVVRFTNDEVLSRPRIVSIKIMKEIHNFSSPLPVGEGGPADRRVGEVPPWQ